MKQAVCKAVIRAATPYGEDNREPSLLLTVGRSYEGIDVTHSTLLACACSYENLPKYRSYRVRYTAPGATTIQSERDGAEM